jgi:ComF family protein
MSLTANGRRTCAGCTRASVGALCTRCLDLARVRGRPHRRTGSAIAPLAALHYLGRYDGAPGQRPNPLARALVRFKYGGDRGAGHALAWLFKRYGPCLDTTVGAIDAIVPVPLHRRRLSDRGYNQAAWFARAASRSMSVIMLPDALVRTVETAPQVGLGGGARRSHVRGAFVATTRHIEGKTLMLVDDVFTTGATLRECARTLLTGGAHGVIALVLFVADNDSDGGPRRTSRAR